MARSLHEDLEAVRRIAAMPSILELAAQVSHMRFVAVTGISEDRVMLCAVLDRLDQGVAPGDELDIKTTICGETLSQRRATIIDDVSEDPIFRDHPAPSVHRFRSYISVPIVLGDGSLFGSLYAIERNPVKLGNSPAGPTFNLLSRLIALELDSRLVSD